MEFQMMAHHKGDIVTIREIPSKAPLRGYAHKREGDTTTETFFLPFGSEYGIGFKFRDGVRRRLELSIDGTKVCDNLIIDGEEILERFLDTAKRFKFVSAESDGVGDPTSKENGKIVVRLYRELQPTPMIKGGWGVLRSRGQRTKGTDVRLCAQNFVGGDDSIRCAGFGDSIAPLVDTDTVSCSYGFSSDSIPAATSFAAVGATVEGSNSSQTFGTTHWRGDDGAPTEFIFQLFGKMECVQPVYGWECPSCKTFNPVDAKFCKECGAKIL
jgi:hypothetical protein